VAAPSGGRRGSERAAAEPRRLRSARRVRRALCCAARAHRHHAHPHERAAVDNSLRVPQPSRVWRADDLARSCMNARCSAHFLTRAPRVWRPLCLYSEALLHSIRIGTPHRLYTFLLQFQVYWAQQVYIVFIPLGVIGSAFSIIGQACFFADGVIIYYIIYNIYLYNRFNFTYIASTL